MPEELVYVSWGGTGRGATLRAAMERASGSGRGLLYLAILDDATFADLDAAFLAVVKEELEWLLDAQLDVTRIQLGVDDLPVRVLIRAGKVADRVADVVTTVGDTEVLIGAPVPPSGYDSIEPLLDEVRGRVSVPVELITAGGDGGTAEPT